MVGLGIVNTYAFVHYLTGNRWTVSLDARSCTWIWFYEIQAPVYLLGCHLELAGASIKEGKIHACHPKGEKSTNPTETNVKGLMRRTCSTGFHCTCTRSDWSSLLCVHTGTDRRAASVVHAPLLLPLLASLSSSALYSSDSDSKNAKQN